MNGVYPLISVITIAYNSEKEIKKTIHSVEKQNYTNYEYIIIDGKSQDKTVHIAQKYTNRFKQKNICFTIVSEPDTGIYNAMNKGVKYAQGKWIVFMNAGDCFYDENVLSIAAQNCEKDEYGLIYGNHVGTRYGRYKPFSAESFSKIVEDMPFCHQSVYTKRELLLKYPFDETYKMAADYDFFAKLYNAGIQTKWVDSYFSIYSCDGISYTKTDEMWKERYLARRNNQFISEDEYVRFIRKMNDKVCLYDKETRFCKKLYQSLVPAFIRRLRGISRERKRLKKEGWTGYPSFL